MPRPYPPEFMAYAIALVHAGKQVKQNAHELGISAGCLRTWLKQDRIDRGETPATPLPNLQSCAARNRIRELENGAVDHPAGIEVPGKGQASLKRIHPVIDRLADTGVPVDNCCRGLGVSRQRYYRYKRRPTSATELRRQWLTRLIREVHVASRGTYGYRRIHAALTTAMGITCSSLLISAPMPRARIYGPPGPTRVKPPRGVVTADEPVNREFHRLHPNKL